MMDIELLSAQIPSEYKICKSENLSDKNSIGLILQHKKSGARVCVISNDDENKMFCAAFRTPPEDDCGKPHILEHSVLCGSERYPVKDPFMQLLKGSMQTFLNAMTYPDKTMYPVSSCNDRDFVNLMNVYLDAVFAPNIFKHPEIFMQEGWHYEPGENGEVTVNGVVYSEMKGVKSSPDSDIYDELLYTLFPDNTYGKNSGGEPGSIIDLSYEDFLDFYKKYYHPSNAYIMLYGNLDVRERLTFMDREYLSRYDEIHIDSAIEMQKPFGQGDIKKDTKYYPISKEESSENKTYLAFGSVCADSLDPVECYAWDFLSDILVEAPGATVKTALTEAGIGQEIYGGMINHMRTPVFTVIAKGTEAENADKFMTVVTSVLLDAVKNGVNKKSLLAAIERSDFRYREGEQSTASHGLALMSSMMQSWLYSEEDPFRYLRVSEIYDTLRSYAKTDYFERLLEDMLNFEHSAQLCLVPKAGLNEENAEELRKKLLPMKDKYTEVKRDFEKLTEYQDREESEEELKCIPTLSKSDIATLPQPIYNRDGMLGGMRAVIHDIPTNGLCYVKLFFDLSHVPTEDMPYVDLLSDIYGKADTVSESYKDLLDEIRINTGGFSLNVITSKKHGENNFKVYFTVSLKMFAEKANAAFDTVRKILTETCFNDTSRIREILSETVSEKQRDILYSGSEYASARSLAYFSAADAVEDMTDGIGSYQFQAHLLESFDKSSDKILLRLAELSKIIISRDSCIVSAALDDGKENHMDKALRILSDAIPEKNETFGIAVRLPLGKLNEGIMTSSEVQYVAMGGNIYDAGYESNGAHQVLASLLKNDYLYPMIRMKGGAYGYTCVISGICGNISLATYRDPCLAESLDVFRGCGDWLRRANIDDSSLTKLIIGTFGKQDRPLTPYMKASRSMNAYLSNVSYEKLCKNREEMLNVSASELKSYADMIDDSLKGDHICVIGNEKKIADNRDLFENTVRLG